MTALEREDGTRVGAADVATTTTSETYVTINEKLFKRSHYGPFDKNPAGDKVTVAFKPGDRLTQAQYDDLFPAATITAVTPNSGPAAGGNTVTITGTGLDGATGVTFGGVAVAAGNFEVVEADTITAVVPAHAAGVVDVAVTDESGTATLTGGYTYV